MGNLTTNFSSYEFACPCCGYEGIDPQIVLFCQGVRDEVGHPVKITSGCRCFQHNLDVGGSAGSDHLIGKGVDISCTTSKLRYAIVRAAMRVGVTRLGVGKNIVHIGINEVNPQEVIWVYS